MDISSINDLLTRRAAARAARDFATADQIRSKIEMSGFSVRDTRDGQQVRPNLIGKLLDGEKSAESRAALADRIAAHIKPIQWVVTQADVDALPLRGWWAREHGFTVE